MIDPPNVGDGTGDSVDLCEKSEKDFKRGEY
jgi:hypothetical protein